MIGLTLMIAYNEEHGFVKLIKEFIFEGMQYYVVKTQRNVYTGLEYSTLEILGE
jgi:hypothetical protein